MAVNSDSTGSETSDKHLEHLDFSRVHFPSDKISILALRQLFPKLFDVGYRGCFQPSYFIEPELDFSPNAERGPRSSPAESGIAEIIVLERVVAAAKYANIKGLRCPDDWIDDSFDGGTRGALANLYVEYKISPGLKHAMELIRDIERQMARLEPQLSPVH